MRRALMIVAVLTAANFVAFMVGAVLVGGDAWNGKVEDGRYFLGDHGRLREVSAEVFTYSLWHARSMIATHPIAMLAAWLAARAGRRGAA